MIYELNVNGFKIYAHYDKEDIENVFKPLLRRWKKLQLEKGERIFVFLAAPPGCGKTTLSLFLETLSKEAEFEEIQAIGMDGFHFTNTYLSHHYFIEEGVEVCLKKRKGSYASFDKRKLQKKIIEGKICNNNWPIYSRELHDPIENQITLKSNIILLEGNYLLLNAFGWEDLIQYCDDSIFLYTDMEVLKERLIQRKQEGGVCLEEAVAFYENSDLKNIQMVMEHVHSANVILELQEGRYKIKKPL